MKQTAVEWLEKIRQGQKVQPFDNYEWEIAFNHAKEMERKERLKHLLLIGKVTEILGFDKTLELLKECNNEIL